MSMGEVAQQLYAAGDEYHAAGDTLRAVITSPVGHEEAQRHIGDTVRHVSVVSKTGRSMAETVERLHATYHRLHDGFKVAVDSADYAAILLEDSLVVGLATTEGLRGTGATVITATEGATDKAALVLRDNAVALPILSEQNNGKVQTAEAEATAAAGSIHSRHERILNIGSLIGQLASELATLDSELQQNGEQSKQARAAIQSVIADDHGLQSSIEQQAQDTERVARRY